MPLSQLVSQHRTLSYVGRVNYVVSLVSLTSLLDRRSEDLGEETTGYEAICDHYHFFCLALASQQHLGRLGGAFDRRQHHPLPAGLPLNFSSFNPGKLVDNQLRSPTKPTNLIVGLLRAPSWQHEGVIRPWTTAIHPTVLLCPRHPLDFA